LDNAFLPNTDMQNRVFRSMIKVGDKIVCIAPLKSIPNDDYSACFHAGDRLRVTEMIEGTMINLFHNGVGWELATKKSIGCDYHYFRTSYEGLETEQKTFRQMFYDAIGTNDLAEFVAKYGFTQDHCYSFVLQHAANHIVLSIDNPRAYLVSCFALSDLHMVDVQTLGYPSLPRIFNYRLGALTNLDGCFSDKPMDDCVEDYATDVLGGIMDAIKNPNLLESVKPKK
jgi:hypothetical protein